MNYVVDTNVISEAMKAKPNPSVLSWMEQNSSSLFLTSITIEELRFGQLMMPEGKRRAVLKSWIDSLLVDFERNILDFEATSAEICAAFHDKAISIGRTPTIEDLMIASIAKTNGCAVVTCNTKDFDYLDIKLVNPFKE